MIPMAVDLFLFSGQSNMAGRGIVCEKWPQPAPAVRFGAGWEYRAVTAPDRLSPMVEPFGVLENRENGIDDGNMKTGSMVSSFTNAYYNETEMPIVGISASKGGSSILEWQPGTPMLEDVVSRLESARQFLSDEHCAIRHVFLVWCQGETDGDHGMPAEEYQEKFTCMWNRLKETEVEKCFLVRIGKYNGAERITYEPIRKAQEELVKCLSDVVMVSRSFTSMKHRALMKDAFHYYQTAYNEVGEEAGKNAGRFIMEQA